MARRTAPQRPADLAQHNYLTYSRFGKGEWRFRAGGTETSVTVGGNLSANETTEQTIWGVYLSRQHVPATMRTLLDFLVQRFEGQPHWDADNSA